MKTNTPHNLKTKLLMLRREIDLCISLVDKVIEETDRQGQTTLSVDADYSEVERWLVEVKQFKTVGEYKSWANKGGAGTVTEMVFEWTGTRLTFPQIRRIAERTLTTPKVEVVE